MNPNEEGRHATAPARVHPRQEDSGRGPAATARWPGSGRTSARNVTAPGERAHGRGPWSWPLPEQRPADPDDGRPLLHRDRVVVAHAHRQGRADRRDRPLAGPPKPAQIGGTSAEPPRHPRPAGRSSSGRAAPGMAARRARRRPPAGPTTGEARLGRVVVDVDLEQDRVAAGPVADLAGDAVEPRRRARRSRRTR